MFKKTSPIAGRLSRLLLLGTAITGLLAQNYKIVNANSGLVLEVPNSSTAPGTLVDQWQWNGGANQQWQLVAVGNGYSYLRNVGTGQYLTM